MRRPHLRFQTFALLISVLAFPAAGQRINSTAFRFGPVVFANLGTPVNGEVRYCSNCNANTSPCTGGGTGAFAYRVGAAWSCGAASADVPATRAINTTSPLGGGGDLSADRTLTCTTCATSSNNLSFFSSTTSAQLRTLLSDESGTGAALFQSGDLGTPTAGVLTNATGLPIGSGVSGLGTGVATFLGTPSSANARSAVTDESGTGAMLFANGALGSATFTNLTSGGTQRYAIDTYGTQPTNTIHLSTTDADSGLFIFSTGSTNGVFGGGVLNDSVNWIAKSATPAFIQSTTTGFNIFADTGKTIGASYTPTKVAAITPSGIVPTSTLGIVGTTTNDNPAAGSVGEVISCSVATGSSVSLTTATTTNICSVSLTAGDWDCRASVAYTFGATTSYTNLIQGISTTSATVGAQGTFTDFETTATVPTAGADMTWVTPDVRELLSSTTTTYLVARPTFTVSTLKGYGNLDCRRMR